MDPGIVTRYRRYKVGTRQIVQYLFDLASKHGDASSLSWVNARTAGAKRISIKTHQLEDLARHIAAAEPTVRVSDQFWCVLADVIALRKECSAWYAAQAIDDDSSVGASNRRHTFFLDCLQRIQNILRKCYIPESSASLTAASPARDQRAKNKSIEVELKNLFECLHLEQPKAEPLGNLPAATVKSRGIAKDVVLEDDTDDRCMALWSFLSDMNDIRTVVRDLWAEHREGKVSLPICGFVTETALGMIKRAYQEFVASHSQLSNWGAILAFLRLKQCVGHNIMYCFPQDVHSHIQQAAAPKAPTDLLFTPAGTLLPAFSESVAQHGRAFDRTDIIYCYDTLPAPRTPRLRTSFEPVLLGMAQEIFVLERAAISKLRDPKSKIAAMLAAHCPTEFTDGLLDLNNSKKATGGHAPMWMVVACQICIDVHEAVNFSSDCGLSCLQRATERARRTVEEVLQLDIAMKAPKDIHDARQLEASTVKGTADELSDVVQQSLAVNDHNKRSRMTMTQVHDYSSSKCYYPGLTTLPHIAGEATYSLQRLTHRLGTGIVNDGHAILIVAHLYKAVQHYGLSSRPWADLDFIISQHGGKKPFFTKTSKSADGYAVLRHYLLDLGVEAVAFSKGKMPGVPTKEVVKKRCKKIAACSSEFRQAMHEHYSQNIKLGVHRPDTIETVLQGLNKEAGGKGGAAQGNGQYFSPTQLLSTLKHHLSKEELLLNFDYVPFVKLCIDTMAKACLIGLSEMDLDDGPHKCVHDILKAAADAEAASRPVSKTPLGQVATFFESIIEQRGKEFSTSAHHRCSGHEPKHLRPDFGQPRPDVTSDIQAILQKLPGASIGSSRDTIEIYDPNGNQETGLRLFDSAEAANAMRGETHTQTYVYCPAQDYEQTVAETRKKLPLGYTMK